jgi:hypothetical protein
VPPNNSLERTPTVRPFKCLVRGVGIESMIESSRGRRSAGSLCRNKQAGKMEHWFTGDVIANGVRLHYHRTGGSKPALVITTGVTDTGISWSRV